MPLWRTRFCILLSHKLGFYPLNRRVDHKEHESCFLHVQGKADGLFFFLFKIEELTAEEDGGSFV